MSEDGFHCFRERNLYCRKWLRRLLYLVLFIEQDVHTYYDLHMISWNNESVLNSMIAFIVAELYHLLNSYLKVEFVLLKCFLKQYEFFCILGFLDIKKKKKSCSAHQATLEVRRVCFLLSVCLFELLFVCLLMKIILGMNEHWIHYVLTLKALCILGFICKVANNPNLNIEH